MTTPPPAPLVARDEPVAPVYGNGGVIRHFHVQGYADTMTPEQVIAALRVTQELQQALGEARADASALRVQLRMAQAEIATLEDAAIWQQRAYNMRKALEESQRCIARLTPLAEAAAAWAAAVAEPNGVWEAEQALLKAIKEWKKSDE